MKRLLKAAAALVCAVGIPMFAQGIRFDSRVLTSATNVAPGAQVPVLAIPNATVTVCATGQNPCSPAIPVYANQALTVQAQNPMNTDGQGRFGFWIPTGTYFYTVKDVQGNILGTFPFSVGGSGGSEGGVSIVSVTTANGFTGTVANPTSAPNISINVDGTHYLPLLTDESRWNAAGFITSLTTTGTSGAATVSSGVLNIPQYSGGGGGSMTWPAGGAGIPNYNGSSAWGTSYSASNQIPSTFIPTLNQSTTGNAATATAAVNLSGTQIGNAFYASPNGASGVGSWRRIVSGDIPTLNQSTTGTAANVTGIVAIANGGTGTTTPALVAGTNVAISGTWPNQTISASGAAGVANISVVVASGTQAANTCSSPVTATMTGATTTMKAVAGYSSNPAALTGWGSTGGVVFDPWISATNTLSYVICNQTAASVPYSAITFIVGAN